MAEEKRSVFIENLSVIATPDGFQRYVLGTKGNGDPRALYDVFKDMRKINKKKKGKKHGKGGKGQVNTYSVYLSAKGKKKKKGGKKHNKHWHI